MPAVSKKQRRFFAIAEHHPDMLRGKMPNMSKSEMHKFAATPERGLPTTKKRGLRHVKISGGKR